LQEKWLEAQRSAVADAVAAIASHSPDPGLSASENQARKAELDARAALLQGHAENRKDVGPMLHCVTWHDGDVWRAAVDSSEVCGPGGELGKLADFTPLTNFR
jgi:tripeptidyl-peptidase II